MNTNILGIILFVLMVSGVLWAMDAKADEPSQTYCTTNSSGTVCQTQQYHEDTDEVDTSTNYYYNNNLNQSDGQN